MQKSFLSFLVTFFCMVLTTQVHGLVVGSDSLGSRETALVFPSSDSDNTIIGFAALEDGFALQDSHTTCTFDAFERIDGAVHFAGGSFFLKQDVDCAENFEFGSAGTVKSILPCRVVSLPKRCKPLVLPTNHTSFIINEVDTEQMSASVSSVDWSYNDQYVAAGSSKSSSSTELRVYYFDGATLTPTQSIESDVSIASVRWHPTEHYLAVARDRTGPDEVQVYYLNTSNGTMGVTDGRDFSNKHVRATAWHPSGNFLAVGSENSSKEVCVYSFSTSTGLLTDLVTLNLSGSSRIAYDSMSWSPDGNYLVIGTLETSGHEFYVYSFDGANLNLVDSSEIDENVESVDWSPVGNFIAMGMRSGSDRLRVYKLNGSTLQQVSTANLSINVFSVHWDTTGEYLLVGTYEGISSAVKIYKFDQSTFSLEELSSIASTKNVRTVRWSRSSNYFAHGDDNRIVTVSQTSQRPLIFENIILDLNGPVDIKGEVIFKGNCLIKGNGHKVLLKTDGSLLVHDHSNLMCMGVCFDGIKNSNIRCINDSANIVLNNTGIRLLGDYTFTQGALLFDKSVVMQGSHTFVFAPTRTTTLAPLSKLFFDNNLTLSYDPQRPDNKLLYLDPQAHLFFGAGTSLVSTRTGFHCDMGSITFDYDVTVSSQGRNRNEAITFASTASINVRGGAYVDLHGLIVYE